MLGNKTFLRYRPLDGKVIFNILHYFFIEYRNSNVEF